MQPVFSGSKVNVIMTLLILTGRNKSPFVDENRALKTGRCRSLYNGKGSVFFSYKFVLIKNTGD